MIESIEKIKKNNTLEVIVTCHIRQYAKNPISLLTTEKLIDILNKEYKISETLEEPINKIGNSNVKKVSNIGRWLFKLDTKTRRKPTNKKKTNSTQPASKDATSSIRSRISNIANKKQIEEEP
tara:strand:+ start:69 stop:437 length:369 start_codon:yes stop_codon:yes gene_type:complete